MVHIPVHASWLNQYEIYFSVVQREVVTPNDFYDLADVKNRLMAFQDIYNLAARPFDGKYTKKALTPSWPASPPTNHMRPYQPTHYPALRASLTAVAFDPGGDRPARTGATACGGIWHTRTGQELAVIDSHSCFSAHRGVARIPGIGRVARSPVSGGW